VDFVMAMAFLEFRSATSGSISRFLLQPSSVLLPGNKQSPPKWYLRMRQQW
jgi:hypothetical protein